MGRKVRFGSFEADMEAGQLCKRGVRIALRDKSFQVLASLLEHPGEVVTREELERRLWPDDVFVDFDNNLNTAIARLRAALGESSDHPRYIETLPKRGYRFAAEVYETPAVRAEPAIPRARLVVLPFANLSGDPTQEYFSDAITDEVITELARLAPEHLAVIARTTAMRYKHGHKDVARIARELGVQYVVEGAMRRANDRVAINVQFIQARDQTHLFAERYEAEMHDIFSLNSRIAETIARHVPSIAEAMRDGVVVPERIRRKPTEDLAAYNQYIKGRYEMYKLSPEGLGEAIRHFEAAIAHDSKFALPCIALAELYWYMGLIGYAPSKETDLVGRSYALRALEADGSTADAHAMLSFFPAKRNCPGEIDYYDWAQIQNELAQARKLDPTSRLVRFRYALVQAEMGHPEEGAAELELTLESDPLSLEARSWLAIMLYLSGNFDRALEQALRNLDLEPDYFAAYDIAGQVYLCMQRYKESTAAFQKAVELCPDVPSLRGWLGLSLGLGGHIVEARKVMDQFQALARQRYVPPTCFAWGYLGVGDIDEAFIWLERAIDAPDRMIEPIKTYPFLDPLRADPRFAALVRKMNLG